MRTHAGTRLGLVVYAIGAFVYRDALMDDTFIHLVYARNLRELGQLAFNPGEPSMGFTSPLWLLLLAALGPGLAVAKLASLACGGLSVYAFAAIAHRVLGAPPIAVAATVAWAGNLWLMRHAANGMETMLAVLLVLSVVAARLQAPARRVLFGVLAAAGVLVRPECALLAGAYAAFDLASPSGRRRVRVWLPVCGLLVGAWAVVAQLAAGQALPDTAGAKSAGVALAPLAWLRVLGRELRILAPAHAPEMLVLLAAALLGLLSGRGRRGPAWWRDLGPYALFTLLLLGAFALGQVQVQPRYLVLVSPWLVLTGFAAWLALLGGGPRLAAVACALSLATGAAASVARVYASTRDFSRGLRPALEPLALQVAADERDSLCIATPDIGLVGWVSRARVLDLGGLIDPIAQRWTREHGYDAVLRDGVFLERGPVHYVIDRSVEPARFQGHETHGLRWQAVQTTTIPNLGLSRPGPFYYTLYALERAHAP